MSTKFQRVNDQIRAPKLRLVGAKGEDLGVVATMQALELAKQQGLDLVEVAPNAAPPVARIMDYGAYRYRMEKQAQAQRKHQKKIEIKGIRIGMRISQHDFDHKADQAKKFLAEGHKIKLELVMRGREQAPQLRGRAIEKLKSFITALGPDVLQEQDITKQGNRLTLLLGLSKKAKNSQSQQPQQHAKN